MAALDVPMTMQSRMNASKRGHIDLTHLFGVKQQLKFIIRCVRHVIKNKICHRALETVCDCGFVYVRRTYMNISDMYVCRERESDSGCILQTDALLL